MMSGVGGDPFNRVIATSHIMQTEARHDLASLDEMRMRVDKCGRQQPPTKINFSLPWRCASGRLIVADEADETSVGHHSSRSWVVRSVDASPNEDHELIRDEGAQSDLRAVLERNRKDRRGVRRHLSRCSDPTQC